MSILKPHFLRVFFSSFFIKVSPNIYFFLSFFSLNFALPVFVMWSVAPLTELIGCLSLSSNQVTAVALWKEIQQLFTETLFSTNVMMKFTRRPCLPHPTILKKSKFSRRRK